MLSSVEEKRKTYLGLETRLRLEPLPLTLVVMVVLSDLLRYASRVLSPPPLSVTLVIVRCVEMVVAAVVVVEVRYLQIFLVE
jgi:hypothetical protein